MSSNFTIGRGKPPTQSRFTKGQSGNPHGRPRKASPAPANIALTSIDAIVLNVAQTPVSILVGGKASHISLVEAAQLRQAQSAVGGNRLATKELTNRARDAQVAQLAQERDRYSYWRSYCRTHHHEPLNWPAPSGRRPLLPHPLDIQIDPLNLTVCFVGPMEREELPAFQLPLLLRDMLLIKAELRQRAHGSDDPMIAVLCGDAAAIHTLIVPSLGGPAIGEAPEQALHRLVAVLMDLRRVPTAQLWARLHNYNRQFEGTASRNQPWRHESHAADKLALLGTMAGAKTPIGRRGGR